MKAIEFGEERLTDIEGLARELWQDERDPRSSAYVRVLERPPVHWGRVFAWTVLPFVFTAALLGLAYSLGLSEKACLVFGAVLLALYGLACLKRGIIGAIRIYQRYAPACLRNKCRFEPSCSQYMILSLEKYGLIRGLRKGVDRLRRCNVHGGGFDDP